MIPGAQAARAATKIEDCLDIIKRILRLGARCSRPNRCGGVTPPAVGLKTVKSTQNKGAARQTDVRLDITCPKCGNKIQLTEAFIHEIEEKLRAQFEGTA